MLFIITSFRILYFRRVQVEVKRNISKACVLTVGLYRTEALVEIKGCEDLYSKMSIIQRKVARILLGAGRNVADETFERELFLTTIEGAAAIRLMRRSRLATTGEASVTKYIRT